MEHTLIKHPPQDFDCVMCRRLEIEHEISDCPVDKPEVAARCPDCGSTMMYRGIGRLRSGTTVHTFECVHSHREVHSLSIIISE